MPPICPEYGKEEWESVGRILLKGWLDHQIFPITISPAFCITLVHGESALTPNVLIESCLKYLSAVERDIVQRGLNETGVQHQSTTEDDTDILLDILSSSGCLSIPDASEMKPTFLQLAHKQLVQ